MIGQWLRGNAPERLTALVLANTSPRFPDPGVMEQRRCAVLEGGMAAVEEGVMGRFFSSERLASKGPEVAGTRRVLLATNPAGYAGCCAAVRDMNQTAILRRIRKPTLIVVGNRDVSTPWSGHGEVLAREIGGAHVERLDTAHLSNLERPRCFSAALLRFLVPEPSDLM